MNKSPDAFRTISEVADELDLPQHVLRFWETRFNQIKPMKRGGGRRYYRPEDVELLSNIKTLLYREGYTIRGVQRLLKEQGAKNIDPQSAVVGGVEKQVPTSAREDGGSDVPSPSRSAMNVEEYSRQQSAKKGKSFLNRISGMVGGEEIAAANLSVDADDMTKLKATLHELLECKRLLDQTRQE